VTRALVRLREVRKLGGPCSKSAARGRAQGWPVGGSPWGRVCDVGSAAGLTVVEIVAVESDRLEETAQVALRDL